VSIGSAALAQGATEATAAEVKLTIAVDTAMTAAERAYMAFFGAQGTPAGLLHLVTHCLIFESEADRDQVLSPPTPPPTPPPTQISTAACAQLQRSTRDPARDSFQPPFRSTTPPAS